MNIHVIVDFMHIYYKYFFQNREGRLTKLSAPINWKGTVIQKDTTLIYYPLKDIEGIRKQLLELGHNVTMSICFDSKSSKTEDDNSEYKANRTHLLSDTDKENIDYICELLKAAGHNTYKLEGYEADDIANYLAKACRNSYDYTIIYTNDKDLIVNVDEKTGVMRFKQFKGYTQVDRNNYEQYLLNEFGVMIPYNALGLYLATVGDSADNIKGIYRFGKSAFSKLITKVASANVIDWSKCGDYNELYKVVELCKDYLTLGQYTELLQSFALVANAEIGNQIMITNYQSNKELREQAYSHLNMLSLIP